MTNEAEVISAAVCERAGQDLLLTRNKLRVVDAGTGDGRVLKGIADYLLRYHCERPCEMLLKEYDFHHIEMLLENMAPVLRRSPRLTVFVTNRAFRHLKDFVEDLCVENTVCFDDIAGYRLLAMGGAASVLNQGNSLRFSFPVLETRGERARAGIFFGPLEDLWKDERMLRSGYSPVAAAAPALVALGDEIRAREIYDELAAVGRGKHFTVTITRREDGAVGSGSVAEFFWDLAVVSHAFNRDKDPGWICRNILGPLCEGLAVGGVLVNVHAIDEGPMLELKEATFGGQFHFSASPDGLSHTLRSALGSENFQLLPFQRVSYRSEITWNFFASHEPWQQELLLERLVISTMYHLQIPHDSWTPLQKAIEAKIQHLLERDGRLEYRLSVGGVRRLE